jgi:DivIVA domain-containing protein
VDRDEIERQDFPAARRGYDAAAVHEHLRRVADEFEALARRPAPGSLAEGASARVQAIVEAAETSAQQLREDATREASEHVERVGEAARELLARIDSLQAELDRLMSGLRTTAAGLAGSLDEVMREVGTLAGRDEVVAPAEADEPVAAVPTVAPAAAPAANGALSDDEAGARLVALNMALEGASRDEAGRYLAEHYELTDLDALLDDVYASAGR